MMNRLTEQTMSLLKKLQSDPVVEKLSTTTGVTTSTGIVNYNLEPYAKTLYPVITPIRNVMPRFTDGNGGSAVHWKVITAINPGRTFPGTAEGIRGAVIDQTEDDKLASFVRFSLENYITEEAIMQAQGFDNALAIAADNLLRSMFIAEEEWMLVGNGPTGLAQPSAPAGTAGGTGTVANAATYARVAVLTYDGWKRDTVAGGLITQFQKSSAAQETQAVNGGVSKMSSASASVTPSGTQAITWTVAAVQGAFAYAWFVGAANTAGSCHLAAITTVNTWIETLPVSTYAGNQADNADGAVSPLTGKLLGTGNDWSKNTSAFDGLIIQTLAGNGQYSSLDGAKMTSQADGSITEIDNVLQAFYDTYKVSPTKMWVGTQQARDITTAVMKSGAAPVYRINVSEGKGQSGIQGANFVDSYLNKFAVGGPRALPIEVHPNMPSGKIFFDCNEIPYPLANIPGPYRMHMLRDYYQRLWPQVTETRYSSVNFYGVLQVYTPFAMGLLDNIGAGVN